MKRYLIILVLFSLCIAGCNPDSSTAVRKNKDDTPGASEGGIPIGGPSYESDHDDYVPVEDEESAQPTVTKPSPKKPLWKKKSQSTHSPGKIVIYKTSNTFGKLVLDKNISIKITVSGGSGKFVSNISDNPSGTSLKHDGGRHIYFEGAPNETGDYSATLTVTDANNSSNIATKTIGMKVVEDIAINLYKKNDDGTMWTKLEPPTGDSIILPPYGWLRLKVVSAGDKKDNDEDRDPQANSFTWYMSGEKIACDENGCSAAADGLEITSVDPDTMESSPKKSVMFLHASEIFTGKEFKHISIVAADNDGNEAKLTINSLVVKGDPCEMPLKLLQDNVVTTLKIGSEFKDGIPTPFAIKVEGGSGKYNFDIEIEDDSTIGDLFELETIVNEESSNPFKGKILTTPKPGTSMEVFDGSQYVTYKITVNDTSCTALNAVDTTLKINMALDDKMPFYANDVDTNMDIGFNDTDDHSRLEVFWMDKDENEIAQWDQELLVDPYGDNSDSNDGSDWYCDFLNYDDHCHNDVTEFLPKLRFTTTDLMNIRYIEKVRYRVWADHDENGNENIDATIWSYHIIINDWCGEGGSVKQNEYSGSTYEDHVKNVEWYTIGGSHKCGRR